jgi:hypothetical protein
MIDDALITPDGRITETRYDVEACLYAIERGLWTACGYDIDRQVVLLDWGGVPRTPSKGFRNAAVTISTWTDNGPGRRERKDTTDCVRPVPEGLRPRYEVNWLAIVKGDYVRKIDGNGPEQSMKGISGSDQVLIRRAIAMRKDGLPTDAIAVMLTHQAGYDIAKGRVANWVRHVECLTVDGAEGRRLICQARASGASEIEICERTGLSRRLVSWIIEGWKK